MCQSECVCLAVIIRISLPYHTDVGIDVIMKAGDNVNRTLFYSIMTLGSVSISSILYYIFISILIIDFYKGIRKPHSILIYPKS